MAKKNPFQTLDPPTGAGSPFQVATPTPVGFAVDELFGGTAEQVPAIPEVMSVNNPDGSASSERTITVEAAELNGGKPTLIPTLIRGKQLSDDEAIRFAIRSGLQFPSFNSLQEANAFASQRSRTGGAEKHGFLGEAPASGGTRSRGFAVDEPSAPMARASVSDGAPAPPAVNPFAALSAKADIPTTDAFAALTGAYGGEGDLPRRMTEAQEYDRKLSALIEKLDEQEDKYRELAKRFVKAGESSKLMEEVKEAVYPSDRQRFLEIVQEETQRSPPKKRGKMKLERDTNLLAEVFETKVAQRAMRGANLSKEMMAQFGEMLDGLPGDERGVKFERQAQALRRAHDPAAPDKSQNPFAYNFERGMLGAAEMVPRMATGLALGAPTAGVGAMAYWYTQIAPARYQEYLEEGFSPKEAKTGAMITAAPEALIEMIQGKQLLPKSLRKSAGDVITKTARQFFKKWGIGVGKQYGRELGEELLQDASALTTQAVMEHINGKVDIDWMEEFKQTGDQLVEAAVAMPFLLGPGAVMAASQGPTGVGGPSAAAQQPNVPPGETPGSPGAEVPPVPEPRRHPLAEKPFEVPPDVPTPTPEAVGAQENIPDLLPPIPPPPLVEQLPNPTNPEDGSVEDHLDAWFADRDEQEFISNVNTTNLEGAVKTAVGERHYGKRSRRVGQLLFRYIEAKQYPGRIEKYYDRLSPEEQQLADESQNLPPELRAIGDKIIAQNKALGLEAMDRDIIRNVLDNYTAHLWKAPEPKKPRTLRARFRTKTSAAKPRTLDSIWEGLARGMELQVDDAIVAQNIRRTELAQVIIDRNLLKTAQKAGLVSDHALEDDWAQIEHPNFQVHKFSGDVPFDPDADPTVGDWVRPTDRGNLGKIVETHDDGTANVHFVNRTEGTEATKNFPVEQLKGKVVRPRGKNFYITDDGTIMERRKLYAEPELAKRLNRALSQSKLRGVPGFDVATKYNAIIKHTILMTSLFHHQAFLRSSMLASKSARPIHSYKEGRQAILNMTPEIRALVRGGLTLGRMQDWEGFALQQKTAIGKVIDRVPGARKWRDELIEFRDWQTDILFKYLGASLKAQAAILEYRHQLKKHAAKLEAGTMTHHEAAKRAADIINADFGGLHLGRMGRDPTLQHIMRLLLLAPDWTESNVRSMYKAFERGEQGAMYRAMWGRVAIKGMGATILFNLVLSGFDDKDFWERYQRAWKEGKMRWLDIDVTPIYRALGYKNEKRKWFSLIGHFRDPLKFILHTGRSAKHKGSVLSRFASDFFSGSDWAGRRFTTGQELFGVDEKGRYRTTRRGVYYRGQPKGGKLKGQLVKSQFGAGVDPVDIIGSPPVLGSELPSFLLYEARQSMPIPMQQMLAWLAGEIDGFDAATKGAGMMTSTTYEEGGEDQGWLIGALSEALEGSGGEPPARRRSTKLPKRRRPQLPKRKRKQLLTP